MKRKKEGEEEMGEDLRKGGENNKIVEHCEASKIREYASITRSRGTLKRITDP